MRKNRNEALKLRLKGKSYNEISNLMGIPKSTLSGWFTNLELSHKAKQRIQKRVYAGSLRGLIRRNKNQTHLAVQRMRSARSKARNEIQSLSKNDIKLIGVALYWAEGYKRALVKNGRELT